MDAGEMWLDVSILAECRTIEVERGVDSGEVWIRFQTRGGSNKLTVCLNDAEAHTLLAALKAALESAGVKAT